MPRHIPLVLLSALSSSVTCYRILSRFIIFRCSLSSLPSHDFVYTLSPATAQRRNHKLRPGRARSSRNCDPILLTHEAKSMSRILRKQAVGRQLS